MKEKLFNISIEKIFVVIALVFGFLYTIILPPFQSVDEASHFFRAYQISEGNFKAKHVDNNIGDYLPTALHTYYQKYQPMIKNIDNKTNFANIKEDFNIKTDKNDTEFITFSNTALYSPACYIGQLPGIILGKLITNKIALQYYFGRFSNLLMYCLLIFLAIKIIPFYKLPLAVIALMPMSLSVGSAYSSDVMVFGLNFLWTAIILKIVFGKENTNIKMLSCILILLAFFIALTKSYILLIPLCFLITPQKFNSAKVYTATMFAIILSAAAGLVLWHGLISDIPVNMNEGIADPNSQIRFILLHPLSYAIILLKTLIIKLPRLIITMVGVLGWQDTPLDFCTYILYPVILYISMFYNNIEFELNKFQKIVVILTLISGIIITFTSLYIMWSPVENGVILGLNGKYFIPLLIPALLLLKKIRPNYDYEKLIGIGIFLLILTLFSSELSLLHRFYDITPQLYYKI